MLTATDAIDEARPIAAALVQREERQTGSRMAAYERVARTVGASPSWLRKLVGRQDVALAAHHFENLKMAYRRALDRIDAEAAAEKRAFYALGAKHAAHLGTDQTDILAHRQGDQGAARDMNP